MEGADFGMASARRSVEPTRAADLAPQRDRSRLQHHAQRAVDAEPGVPEAGVGVSHFPFGPSKRTGGLTFRILT